MHTKTITITPSILQYEGDAIGRDFLFVLLLNGQEYLYRSFRQKIGHGEQVSIIGQSLGLHLSFEETQPSIHIPVAIMAAELDPTQHEPESRFLGSSTTDFGMNATVLSFDFTKGDDYPHTFVFELSVAVQGDFWNAKGREHHKTAHLKLLMDVEINWDTTQMDIGERVLMEYQAGRRSFRGESLQQIKLLNAKMPGVDFGETNLLWANLEHADLYGSDFKRAIFRAVNASRANLERANFMAANVTEAIFDEANLRGANFSEAQINTSFQHAKAVGANFSAAQLQGSNFQYADLSGASFRNAHLDYVDFRHAILKDVDFTDAVFGLINYENANLQGVKNLNAPSINFDAGDPFEGKTEDYRQGYHEGYKRGYQYAIDHPVYDESAWKQSLKEEFPSYTPPFAAGYELGFMQTYRESQADAGN